jgi:lipid A 4'-phosphatase
MKLRYRSWLAWAALLLTSCLVILLWPELDLWVAHQFHDNDGRFPASDWAWVRAAYIWSPRVGVVITLCALVVIAARWIKPTFVLRGVWRKSLAWLLVVVLGVGLLVHEGLKNQVGRPRPAHTVTMGGDSPFIPALQTSHLCQRNCSFVSGHAAIGFCIMTLGLWSAPAARRRWWILGTLVGSLIGLGRIMQGGHYLSDVIFSLLAIWGTHLLIRQVWLHWRIYQLGRP